MARSRKSHDEVPDPARNAPAGPKKGSVLRESLASIVATAVVALFTTTYIVQAYEIPSESMEDTLLIGDRLMVDKLAYAPRTSWLGRLLPYDEVHRGDIIIFKPPLSDKPFVKRVIGLPGDRLRIVRRQVIVNGRLLDESYRIYKAGNIEDYRDNFPGAPFGPVDARWAAALPQYVKDGQLVVPQGHYFVMGDNRDNSLDSRYWGFVPRENVLGKPLLIYWSTESTSTDYPPSGLISRLAGIAEALVHFPQKTRWGRMFRIVHGAQQ